MTFSIIVVCLNAGDKLCTTVESIRNQTEQDYEIIIKDGDSTDPTTLTYLNSYRHENDGDTTQDAEFRNRIRLYCGKDSGIYDAMNRAVQYVRGDYVLFLNCGDSFHDSKVLKRVKEYILRAVEKDGQQDSGQQTVPASDILLPRYIFYGDIYERRTDTFVQSNPVIDDFACYRNVPCHQACFYDARLLREKSFDTGYMVRADYEHFLWCYCKARAKTVYMPVTVAYYEGGGFSETRDNEKKSQQEHREIVNRYLSPGKVRRYRLIMLITLAPVRTWLARNPVTARIYQGAKRRIYKK